MKRDVLLSPRAQRDVEAIWDYTVETWGDAQAETYIRQIEAALKVLADTPEIARACDDIRAGYRKYPVGAHIVFFRATAKQLAVIRILHQSMDIERHL